MKAHEWIIALSVTVAAFGADTTYKGYLSDKMCASAGKGMVDGADLKNKPETGLQIMWDLKKDGDQWSGGQILDPHNGKVYRCYISLEDGGKKLKVRGYIGFAMIGRTEYWQRME